MTRPLPTSAGLPEEVPIRSGGSASAPPTATASPEGAAGRAEVTAEVGGTGSAHRTRSRAPLKEMTSSRIWAEVEVSMAAAEKDADHLYRYALIGRDRDAAIHGHLEARAGRR